MSDDSASKAEVGCSFIMTIIAIFVIAFTLIDRVFKIEARLNKIEQTVKQMEHE